MKSADHQDCQTMYPTGPSSRRQKRKGDAPKRRDAMSYKVTLIKGKNNMVGISIGGGSPFCPCLYVVQVFHRTPAADDGSLAPGDELVNVNGTSLQGLSRRETARIIQEARVNFACIDVHMLLRSCLHSCSKMVSILQPLSLSACNCVCIRTYICIDHNLHCVVTVT